MASLLAKTSPCRIPYQRQKKLQKAGNINENIAAEDIVGWSDMMNGLLAKGPKKEKVKFDFGRKSSLVVLYEILLPTRKFHQQITAQRESRQLISSLLLQKAKDQSRWKFCAQKLSKTKRKVFHLL